MRVSNVHRRLLEVRVGEVATLLDSLSSEDDQLWPHTLWPPMAFDGPLAVGAKGGHGPIRYAVEAYRPGQSVRFRFHGPVGFDGHHGFDVVGLGPEKTLLRHTLEMVARGKARLSWPLVFEPLHDALIEDALARAEVAIGQEPRVVPWSPWVRMLRGVLTRGKGPAQHPPHAPSRASDR